MFAWDWSHLNPTIASEFQWIYGSTPMSDLSVSLYASFCDFLVNNLSSKHKVIYTSWVAYFIVIISVRWYMAERTRIGRSHKALRFYNGSMIICSVFVWYISSTSTWKIVVIC